MPGMKQECAKCGEPLSPEVGITLHVEREVSTYYCEPCAPNRGKGYTLSDFEQMREERQAARAAYELSQIDRVGPDVYFYMKGQS